MKLEKKQINKKNLKKKNNKIKICLEMFQYSYKKIKYCVYVRNIYIKCVTFVNI